jgi:hypothetical protein
MAEGEGVHVISRRVLLQLRKRIFFTGRCFQIQRRNLGVIHKYVSMGLGDLCAHDGYFVRKPYENLPRKECFDRRSILLSRY